MSPIGPFFLIHHPADSDPVIEERQATVHVPGQIKLGSIADGHRECGSYQANDLPHLSPCFLGYNLVNKQRNVPLYPLTGRKKAVHCVLTGLNRNQRLLRPSAQASLQ